MLFLFQNFIIYTILVMVMYIVGLSDFKLKKAILTILLTITLTFSLCMVHLQLGNPRPLTFYEKFINKNVDKANILSISYKENEAIFILLTWNGLDVPKYYVLPWDKELLDDIQKALEQSGSNDPNGIEMDVPFNKSVINRTSPVFVPKPQPNSYITKEQPNQQIIDLN